MVILFYKRIFLLLNLLNLKVRNLLRISEISFYGFKKKENYIIVIEKRKKISFIYTFQTMFVILIYFNCKKFYILKIFVINLKMKNSDPGMRKLLQQISLMTRRLKF